MIYNIKIFHMGILNFNDFLNESLLINESLKVGDAYLVGDSCSILMANTKELKGKINTIPDLAIGGIGTYKFSETLKDYKMTHPEAKFIFLSMGANDVYKPTSSVIKSSQIVKEELTRIFPNAQKFVISAGSWGWGGLKKYGISKTPPPEIEKYYSEVWEPIGFILVPEYVGITMADDGRAVHPGLNSPGVRELAYSILDIVEGTKEFFSEDIRSMREVKSISTDEEEILRNYYDVLQDAVHEGISLTQTYTDTFNPIVERAQIGLRFFGYPLPAFGVDGIFGPETQKSLLEYKRDQKVEGNLNEMDDYFFISLIANLKANGFTSSDIDRILEESYGSIENYGEEQTGYSIPVTGGIGGDDEYLTFVQHNQGVTGALSLLKAKYGIGEIYPSTKKSGMVANIPSDMEKEWGSQIREALKSGDDKRAATLFLEMWKIKYASKKQRGLELINKPEMAEIKKILQSASVTSGIPFETLVAIGTIESGLKPTVGNRTYKGLFALNPSTAVKYNPAINQSTVHDPVINADAASKMLATNKASLIQGINRAGLAKNLDIS
jgi:hypothetical protein